MKEREIILYAVSSNTYPRSRNGAPVSVTSYCDRFTHAVKLWKRLNKNPKRNAVLKKVVLVQKSFEVVDTFAITNRFEDDSEFFKGEKE